MSYFDQYRSKLNEADIIDLDKKRKVEITKTQAERLVKEKYKLQKQVV